MVVKVLGKGSVARYMRCCILGAEFLDAVSAVPVPSELELTQFNTVEGLG